MRIARVFGIVLLLVLVPFLVVACGPADDVGEGEPIPEGGGDLIIATLSDAVSMDPHGSNDVPSSNIAYNIYESLVYFDMNSELQPLLATEWEALDDTTWEFTLREGVKFHDDTDFTAEAVKATFDRLLDPDIASPRLFLFGMIEEVIVVDDYTVQFVTQFPFAPLPAHLAHNGGAIISPAAIEKDYAEMAAGNEPGTYLSQNPVGTGFFRFENWTPGSELTLVRYENYWGEPAQLESVTFKVVPENLTRLSELETGFAHIADPIQPSDLSRVENMPNAHIYTQSSTSLAYIGFQCEKEPFNDVRVRQAISMAINKDDIIEGVYEGTAIPAVGPIAPGVFGYDPSVSTIPYDVDQARELLVEAGYADGFSTSIWTNDNPARIQIAEYVQSKLSELNIDVSIEVVEWGAYLDGTAEGNHEMFILGWSTPTLDADYATYALFHSSNIGAPGNRSYFSDPEVDELLDLGRQESDPDLRLQYYREVQEKLVELAPMLYLLHIEDLVGVSDSVKNFEMTSARIFQLRNVYIEQ
ncbi:MAG: glutathione ABC transporter substrate-binding protein [Bacillota bacterium]|nr:glutathione ABC transporter substrate-binding protein [Bacillota bacterium]